MIICARFSATVLLFALIALSIHLDSFKTVCEDQSLQHVESARNRFRIPTLVDFNLFKLKFHKQYTSVAENLVRAKLYLTRACHAFVSALRYKRGASSSYLAINQMSDWLPEQEERLRLKPEALESLKSAPFVPVAELIAQHDGQIPSERSQIKTRKARSAGRDGSSFMENEVKYPSVIETSSKPESLSNSFYPRGYQASDELSFEDNKLPDALFTDQRHCLQAPKFQGQCGSCWLFATLAVYEWTYCALNGRIIDVSPQYLLDCGSRMGLLGCKGGTFDQVRDFMQEYGAELAADYPYTEKSGQCLYPPSTPSHQMGSLRFTDSGFVAIESSDIDQYLAMAPVVIGVQVNGKFQQYGGGVDSGDDCSGGIGWHAMLAVGSGREDGREYWLLRNSYGITWGEFGHYKLDKQSRCVFNDAGYVLIRPTVPREMNSNRRRPE